MGSFRVRWATYSHLISTVFSRIISHQACHRSILFFHFWQLTHLYKMSLVTLHKNFIREIFFKTSVPCWPRPRPLVVVRADLSQFNVAVLFLCHGHVLSLVRCQIAFFFLRRLLRSTPFSKSSFCKVWNGNEALKKKRRKLTIHLILASPSSSSLVTVTHCTHFTSLNYHLQKKNNVNTLHKLEQKNMWGSWRRVL